MPQIEANGTTLHYQLDGPEGGPVVMLSNSLASNLTMWEPQIPALTGAGFRVLRYDSRGHGQSAAPPGPYTMEMLAADAVGLMDALGFDQVHFCGLSKGGMVGQMLGTHHAGRVRSLALCDTAAQIPGAQVWNDRIKAVSDGGMAAVVDATLERWFTPAGHKAMPEEIAKVREMVLTTPVVGFIACCEAIREMDQRETIRAIKTPTVVIVGEDDPGTTVAMAEEIHERIAGSRLVVLPEAAHFSNVEQKVAFNKALLEFLQGV